jgi:hypothetical protein
MLYDDWQTDGWREKYNDTKLENTLDELFIACQELIYSIDRLETIHLDIIFKGDVAKYYERMKGIVTKIEELEND